MSQTNPFIASITTDAQGIVTGAKYFLSSNAGVDELENNINPISVFPNPSNGKFNVDIDRSNSSVIDIYNLMGSKVYSAQIAKGQTTTEIDLSNSAKGIYFVNVFDGTDNYTKKIIVQ
jgi:hypothetical protein